ncbi:Uracil DNA glycosylase superfamily protein [uncultured archaeon]|nr:Uracil DNA glycosylase superfamily protein [uncultured archaeon]
MMKKLNLSETEIQEIGQQIINCDKCKNLLKSRNKAVPGYGFVDATIFFVGLAPGRLGADSTGIPFTQDSSGKLFQLALSSSGISMEPNDFMQNKLRAYVTNLVKCNPKDDKGNNRYPSKSEIDNCKEYLKYEMSLIHFDVIVPLGRLATEIILNQKCSNFTLMHNKLIKIKDQYCIPFIHPSYVIRGAYPKNKYLEDFKSLRGWVLNRNEKTE